MEFTGFVKNYQYLGPELTRNRSLVEKEPRCASEYERWAEVQHTDTSIELGRHIKRKKNSYVVRVSSSDQESHGSRSRAWNDQDPPNIIICTPNYSSLLSAVWSTPLLGLWLYEPSEITENFAHDTVKIYSAGGWIVSRVNFPKYYLTFRPALSSYDTRTVLHGLVFPNTQFSSTMGMIARHDVSGCPSRLANSGTLLIKSVSLAENSTGLTNLAPRSSKN